MIQKYDKNGRQAIKQLSGSAQALFEVIEREEQGEIVDVPGLCGALSDPQFILFSCLSGNGEREELREDLGVLFTTKLRGKAERFLGALKSAGFSGRMKVIVDDTEPVMFWNWKKDPAEITLWCRMVIEEADIPNDWEVLLWSDMEATCRALAGQENSLPQYEDFYAGKSLEVTESIVYHQLFAHIKEFPNNGLLLKLVSPAQATIDKLVQYQFQRLVLNRMLPHGILIQTETPWKVKDPLFHGPLGNSFSSIIHPFEARR